MPVIPALSRLGQEDCQELKDNLGYRVRPYGKERKSSQWSLCKLRRPHPTTGFPASFRISRKKGGSGVGEGRELPLPEHHDSDYRNPNRYVDKHSESKAARHSMLKETVLIPNQQNRQKR